MSFNVHCAFCVQDALLEEMDNEEIRKPDVMIDGTLMCTPHFAEMIEEFKEIDPQGEDNKEAQDNEYLQGGVQEDGQVTAFPDKDR